MKHTCILLTLVTLLILSCDQSNPESVTSVEYGMVTFIVNNTFKMDSLFYRVTVTSSEMDTIGPLHFDNSEDIMVEVPRGEDRIIFMELVELFHGDSVLADTVWTSITVASGVNIVQVSFKPMVNAPIILSHPEDRTISENDTAYFYIIAAGSNITYQWQKNDFTIIDAISDTCMITGAILENSGDSYRCIVSNYGGSDTSRPAELTVLSADVNDVNKDTIPPLIILIGDDTVRVELNDPNNLIAFYRNQFTAVDPEGGEVLFLVTEDDINPYEVGEYTMTYTVRDFSGNEASVKRYILIYEEINVDTIAPFITISDTVLVYLTGTDCRFPNILAYDSEDGIVTDRIITKGEVDCSTPGAYPITVSVSDLTGNLRTAQFYIIVVEITSVDTIKPVIYLYGDDTINVPANYSFTEYFKSFDDPGVLASDNVDVVITKNVTVSVPAKNDNGYWYIAYDVKDAAGNAAETAFRWFKLE